MHSALIPANVRCYSNSDLTLAQLNCPLSAMNDILHRRRIVSLFAVLAAQCAWVVSPFPAPENLHKNNRCAGRMCQTQKLRETFPGPSEL
jgi:hypothetical protein